MFVLLRFIASIFYQILYMSIVATIIGLVILLIQKIINKKISPRYNCIIWFAFILVLLFPLSISSKFSIYNVINIKNINLLDDKHVGDALWQINNDEVKNSDVLNVKIEQNNDNFIYFDWRIVGANIILIFSLGRLVKLLISYNYFINCLGNITVKNERIENIIKECKKELGIKRNINVVNQNIVDSPAIIGLFDVKILFSDNLLLLDDTSLKNMFLHELAHYKRKDNFMNFLIIILNSIYWFNPIIKFVFKYIKQDIEFATDELAIKNMDLEETREYCRTIVETEARRSSRIEPILAFAGELEYIDKRIDLISLRNRFKKFSKIIVILTTFIIVFLCLVFYPTSYCNTTIPKLYLQTYDGIYEEILIVNALDDIKEITIKEGENVKIISNNLSTNSYIYFNCSNISYEDNLEEKASVILNNNIKYLKKGNYLCNFTAVLNNRRSFKYVIKIKVV